jgi:hypothetical protein
MEKRKDQIEATVHRGFTKTDTLEILEDIIPYTE